VVQVASGKEHLFIRQCIKENILTADELMFPERELFIRRKGKRIKECKALFGGYVFLLTENFTDKLIGQIKKLPGFIHFLFTNRDIRTLPSAESQLLLSLVRKRSIIGISKVTFDEGGKIKVLSGPMKDHEGLIVKVDKRKGRAKVRLSLYEKSFLIDFGFEALEKQL